MNVQCVWWFILGGMFYEVWTALITSVWTFLGTTHISPTYTDTVPWLLSSQMPSSTEALTLLLFFQPLVWLILCITEITTLHGFMCHFFIFYCCYYSTYNILFGIMEKLKSCNKGLGWVNDKLCCLCLYRRKQTAIIQINEDNVIGKSEWNFSNAPFIYVTFLSLTHAQGYQYIYNESNSI